MKNIFHVHDEFYRNIVCQSISGSLAGATAGALSNPIDIIKVRKQLLPKDISLSQIVKDLLQEAGPQAFLKGITARMLSMFGSGMVTVSVYELIKRLSRKDSSRQDSM
jgi:solute carrier family 25 S-adenosylmethionine transporter 26